VLRRARTEAAQKLFYASGVAAVRGLLHNSPCGRRNPPYSGRETLSAAPAARASIDRSVLSLVSRPIRFPIIGKRLGKVRAGD